MFEIINEVWVIMFQKSEMSQTTYNVYSPLCIGFLETLDVAIDVANEWVRKNTAYPTDLFQDIVEKEVESVGEISKSIELGSSGIGILSIKRVNRIYVAAYSKKGMTNL